MSKKTQNNLTNLTHLDKKELFLKAFENKEFNIAESCKAINIARQTYYDWLKDDEFKQQVQELKESDLDFTESALRKLIKKGNVIATIFKLKTKGKDRGYIEKQEVELIKPIDEIEYHGLDE